MPNDLRGRVVEPVVRELHQNDRIFLAAGPIRRLCVSLILAEQKDLIAKGQMPRDATRPLENPRLAAAVLDRLRVDEDGLGFDSLARLGLILRVNRFFNLSATGVEDYLLMQRSLGEWVELIGEHFRLIGAEAALTFDTSGSGGPVKHVNHRASGLEAEMRALLAGPLQPFATGMTGRTLTLVPPHHIYGFLFTCLLPMLAECPVLDLHQTGPAAVFRHAKAGDLIIGTPFNWQMLHRTGLRLPDGVLGVTSAGPSTAATWDVLPANGLAQLIEIYGATETGGLGHRTSFSAPFQLLPHLNARDHKIFGPDGVALNVQDRLDWVTSNSFHVQGRRDDVVQVAGVNVSPAEVCRRISLMDGVAEVAVRPGPDRLKAFVVPGLTVRDQAAFEAAVRSHILVSLSAPARPASLTFGVALPRNAMGKVCDWDVSA